MTATRHPFIASAGVVAIAAGISLTTRELGFNEKTWGVFAGLVPFLGCIAHAGLRASGAGLLLARRAEPPNDLANSPDASPGTGRPEEREASGRSNGMGRRKTRPGHHPSSETRP